MVLASPLPQSVLTSSSSHKEFTFVTMWIVWLRRSRPSDPKRELARSRQVFEGHGTIELTPRSCEIISLKNF